jgi:hypothetical protein
MLSRWILHQITTRYCKKIEVFECLRWSFPQLRRVSNVLFSHPNEDVYLIAGGSPVDRAGWLAGSN